MNSSDFYQRKNMFSYLDEVPTTAKKNRTTNLVVMSLFIVVCGYFVTVLYDSTMKVNGEGQVLFKQLKIQLPIDVKIDRMYAKEGGRVNEGDTLFTYTDEHSFFDDIDRRTSKTILSSNNEQINWYYRERVATKERIDLTKLKAQELQESVELHESALERLRQQSILDLAKPEDVTKSENALQELKNQYTRVVSEIAYYQDYLRKLYVPNPYRKPDVIEDVDGKTPMLAYVSPVSGVVSQVFKENYEVNLEDEVVMNIHNPDNIFIKAFYPQKMIKHLREGDLVKVKFPDGSRSQGKLARFYHSTYLLPKEFQHQYQAPKRTIAADIVPVDDKDLDKWSAYYKLNVDLTKKRYNLRNAVPAFKLPFLNSREKLTTGQD